MRGQGGQVFAVVFYFNTQMEINEDYASDIYLDGPAVKELKLQTKALATENN